VNLQQIATGVISAVNPTVAATVQMSTGYTTSADGTRTPTYSAQAAQVQVQALSGKELALLSGLNIQGVLRKIYLNGDWEGLVRPAGKGGDLVTLPDGTVWLIVQVLEHWPDWTSAAIALQNGS
jgi:hypothetical protein